MRKSGICYIYLITKYMYTILVCALFFCYKLSFNRMLSYASALTIVSYLQLRRLHDAEAPCSRQSPERIQLLTLLPMAGFQTHISKCIGVLATKRFARSRIFRYDFLMIISSKRQKEREGMGMGMAISVGIMHVCLHPPKVSPCLTVMAGKIKKGQDF